MTANSLYFDLISSALLLTMLLGSVFTLVIALLLLFMPQRLFALERHANSWISLRQHFKPLEIPRNIDTTLYRYHRPLGLFVLLSCAYIFYQLAFHYDAESVSRLISGSHKSSAIGDWVAQLLLFVGMAINLLLLPFGAILALRPSNLKGFEQWSNRWISTRKAMLPLERSYTPVDSLVKSYPRLFGVLILLFSLNNLYFFLLLALNKLT